MCRELVIGPDGRAFNWTFTRILPDGSDGQSLRINSSGPGAIDGATGSPEVDGYLLLVQGQAEATFDFSTGLLQMHSTTENLVHC